MLQSCPSSFSSPPAPRIPSPVTENCAVAGGRYGDLRMWTKRCWSFQKRMSLYMEQEQGKGSGPRLQRPPGCIKKSKGRAWAGIAPRLSALEYACSVSDIHVHFPCVHTVLHTQYTWPQ